MIGKLCRVLGVTRQTLSVWGIFASTPIEEVSGLLERQAVRKSQTIEELKRDIRALRHAAQAVKNGQLMEVENVEI